jgi:hypothetical protein
MYYYGFDGEFKYAGPKNSCDPSEYNLRLQKTSAMVASRIGIVRIANQNAERPLYIIPPLLMFPLWHPCIAFGILCAAGIIAGVIRATRRLDGNAMRNRGLGVRSSNISGNRG